MAIVRQAVVRIIFDASSLRHSCPILSLATPLPLVGLSTKSLFKLTEEERERKRGTKWEGGEMLERRYPGRPQPLRLDPVCSRPASHLRGFSHTGISLEDFCWPVLCSIEPRLLLPLASNALRNAASDEIPCPSGAPWNSPWSSTRPRSASSESVDPRYSGLVRPNYSVLMRIAAARRSGSDRGENETRVATRPCRLDVWFTLRYSKLRGWPVCVSPAFHAPRSIPS